MKEIFPPSNIYLAQSKVLQPENPDFKPGLGVFASESIKAGEIIEIAPILILEFSDFVYTKWNLLFEYYFWLDDFVVLAFGYGSMYNHSKDSNIEYRISKENETITFTAIKNIKKDEELYFNYNGSSNSKAPLWFQKPSL